MKLPLWTIIPALMLITSSFFIAFKDSYTITEWIIGNGIVSIGIGLIYISENIYKGVKR